jgi:hypothetical protein
MPTCQAILATGLRAGQPCGCRTIGQSNVCGRHWSQRNVVAAPAAPVAAMAADAVAVPVRADPLAAARQAKIDRNNHLIANAPHLSAVQIISYAQRLIQIAITNNIPGILIPKAYTFLKYTSPLHAGYPNLIRAVVTIVRKDNGHHPDAATYADVPAAEREAALNALRPFVDRYVLPDWQNLLRENDPFRIRIQQMVEANRQAEAAAAAAAQAAADAQREREREARRAARQAERAARAERDRAFDHQLREAPVVFQRDPEGSVNLRAFATDNQNIHRSSVQQTTEKAVYKIIERDVPAEQNTIAEIQTDFATKVRWTAVRMGVDTQELVINELNRDYFGCEAFGIPYQAVLDRVWAYIRTHAERKELTIRLAQEVVEGLGMCSNGKMAHLINALQGYDAELTVSAPSREEFQNRISALASRPEGEREAAARALFAEYQIPEAEHAVWLEPLLA